MHLVAQCLEDSHYAFEAAPRAIILRHSILIVLFGPIAHHRRLQVIGYHCHARQILGCRCVPPVLEERSDVSLNAGGVTVDVESFAAARHPPPTEQGDQGPPALALETASW